MIVKRCLKQHAVLSCCRTQSETTYAVERCTSETTCHAVERCLRRHVMLFSARMCHQEESRSARTLPREAVVHVSYRSSSRSARTLPRHDCLCMCCYGCSPDHHCLCSYRNHCTSSPHKQGTRGRLCWQSCSIGARTTSDQGHQELPVYSTMSSCTCCSNS